MSEQTSVYTLSEEAHWILSDEFNFAQVIQGVWMEKLSHATEALAAGQSAGSSIAQFNFLLGGAGLALTVVNTFVGLGLPYMEAAQEAHNRNMKWGFSLGFVSGLFNQKWYFVRNNFVERRVVTGLVAREGTRGLYEGLVAGFVAARKLREPQRVALRNALALELDGLARQQVETCSWYTFVLHFARAFQNNHIR